MKKTLFEGIIMRRKPVCPSLVALCLLLTALPAAADVPACTDYAETLELVASRNYAHAATDVARMGDLVLVAVAEEGW